MDRQRAARFAKGMVLAGLVAVLLALFAPRTGSRSGGLRPQGERKPMADFTMPLLAGGSWALEANRGKVLLVNFWATWCPPCRAETPALVRLGNRYRTHGFDVVGISMDDDPQSVVPPFARRYEVNYPILVPQPGSDLAGAIESLPTSFLLDKRGRIARTYVGAVEEDELEPDIRRLLAE